MNCENRAMIRSLIDRIELLNIIIHNYKSSLDDVESAKSNLESELREIQLEEY